MTSNYVRKTPAKLIPYAGHPDHTPGGWVSHAAMVEQQKLVAESKKLIHRETSYPKPRTTPYSHPIRTRKGQPVGPGDSIPTIEDWADEIGWRPALADI